ncbi:MAG: hypothetical protein ACE5OZ_18140 [Candidatus Heimdallarchaeota archaeon]
MSKPHSHDDKVVPEEHLTGNYLKHSWRSAHTLVLFALCLLPLAVPGILLLTGSSIPFIDANLLIVLLLLAPIPHLFYTGRNEIPVIRSQSETE